MRSFFVFLFAFSYLHTIENIRSITSTLDRSPSAIVEGCVSALTGTYFLSEADIYVSGYEPISIPRVYLSTGHASKNDVWTILPHRFLYEHGGIFVFDPSGSVVELGNVRGKRYEFSKKATLTNTSHGPISPVTNLKNYYAMKHDEKSIDVFAPDGTNRHYRRRLLEYVIWTDEEHKRKEHFYSHYESEYRLMLEVLPNGNRVVYEYDLPPTDVPPSRKEHGTFDRSSFPTRIYTTNPDGSIVYAEVNFRFENQSLFFEGSDGGSGFYQAVKLGNIRSFDVFSHFKGTRGEEEYIEYVPHMHKYVFKTHARVLQGKRAINLTYYSRHKRHDCFDGGFIQTEKSDPRNDRVWTLYQQTGANGEMEPSHLFNYLIPRTGTGYNPVTEVTHIDKSHVRYTFTAKEDFLWKKEFYTSDNVLLKKHEYAWDFTPEGKGNLVSEVTFGRLGKVLEVRHAYEDFSFMSGPSSRVYEGDLTGEGTKSSYRTKYRHGGGRIHLMMSQEEDNGFTEKYLYHNETNLPKQFSTYKDGTCIKLQTWEYDANNQLIQETTTDPITGTRSSKRYVRKSSNPAKGFPEEACTYYNDALVHKERYEYDGKCRVVKKTVFGSNPSPLYTLEYAYDVFGNCIEETDPLGRKTVRRFNELSELVFEQKGSEPFSTTNVYDAMGRPVQITRKTYDGKTKSIHKAYNKRSHVVSETDELGNTTWYENDQLGRPVVVTLPGDRIYRHSYDYFDEPIRTIDPMNREATQTFTAYGKPALMTPTSGLPSKATYHPDGRLAKKEEGKLTYTYEYDKYNNVSSASHYDLFGNLTQTEYTKKYSLFHFLEETNEQGLKTTYTYDTFGRVKTKSTEDFSLHYRYDTLGNVIEETHTLQGKTKLRIISEYDLAGRLLSQAKFGEENELLALKKLLYDAYDNVILVDDSGALTCTKYDSWGRVTEEQDAEGNITRFSYYDGIEYNGLLCFEKTTISPRGTTTIQITSPTQKLLASRTKDSFGTTLSTEKYTYNKNDELIEEKYVSEKTLTLLKQYDERGNLISLTEVYENVPRTTHYSYNEYNEYIQCEKPSGITIHYTYDPEGRIVAITSSDGTVNETRSYDLAGNLVAFTSPDSSIYRSYDRQGNLTEEKLPSGTITAKYNSAGQRIWMCSPRGEVAYTYNADRIKTITFSGLTHEILSYDLRGNITAQKDILGNVYRTTYDLVSRPLSTRSPHIDENASYDAEGNIITYSFQGEEHALAYDPLQQLTQDNESHYSSDAQYRLHLKNDLPLSYDAHGRVLSYNGATFTHDIDGRRTFGEHVYTYDALDRLLSITEGDTVITFSYDTLHRIISKTTNGTTEYYLYDNMTDIGSSTEYRVLGPHGTIALFQEELSVPYTDLIGNIRALIAASPTYYPYSLYGEGYPENASPYRYHGKRQTLTIYNFGARAYDPQTAQWLSEDPAGYKDAPFLHQFLKNNPFRYSDEFGFSVSEEETAPSQSQNILHEFAAHGPFPLFEHALNMSSYIAYSNGWYNSEVYRIGKHDEKIPPIFFTNGIGNTMKDFQNSMEIISELAGGHEVVGIYNSSNTRLIDVVECLFVNMGMRTPASRQIKEVWEGYAKEYGPNAEFLHECHSGGGCQTLRALIDTSASLRKRITVAAFAPAAIIPKHLCKESYNYMSSSDFVSYTDLKGQILYSNQLKILKPHPNASFIDHEFASPTFRDRMKTHIQDYLYQEKQK